MKVFVVLCLATLALGGGEEMTKFNKWAKMKAMESCFGEENMKIWTVQMKKAVAKCTLQDAPELSLPEYRAPYKTVNALLGAGDNMENNEFKMLFQFFRMMHQYQERDHHQQYNNGYPDYRPYNNDYYKTQNRPNVMGWMMKMMMKNKQQENYNNMPYNMRTASPSDDRMDKLEQMVQEFFQQKEHSQYNHHDNMFNNHRNTRAAANNNLDLGDRLVEKLQAEKETMEHKVGNMTCVLKELHVIDQENKIDVAAMKKDMENYNLPSVWFKDHVEQQMDTCYEMATTLPADVTEEYTVTGDFGTINMAQIKMFMGCCHKAKAKLCMNYDIKQKIEENFGPVQDILDQSGLTESQLFPLVMSLLHGQESELDYLM